MRPLLVLLISIGLSGCDTLNRDQLLVRAGGTAEEAKSVEASVVGVVSEFAEEKGLINETAESKAQGTLLCYQSNDVYFPITHVARTVADGIAIDFMHFHPGSGETTVYSKMKNELSAILSAQFGSALTVLGNGQHYEIEQKSP